jgi:glycosyltransferase involved in cell wall biosynthesis
VRILYVIPFFAPAWGYGGPPRLAFDLARQLTRRGHSVHVLTTDALDGQSRAVPRMEILDGVSVQRVPNLSNLLAWKYKILFPPGFGPLFRAALRKAQVVHLFDFRDYQNAVALWPLRHSGVPFVLSALGEIPRATGPKRWAKVVYDQIWGHRLIAGASALLAQTEDEATWYERFGARSDQIRIVPLAVDVDAIRRSASPGQFRASLGIAPSERMVLFLGRIHEYKGIDLLIRAFARVVAARANVRLVIAGRDDGFLGTAKRLAADVTPSGSVIFCGPLYGNTRFDAYSDADLFALTPSHAEQTSLAALEACACGTPALITLQAPIPGLDTSGAGVTVPHDEAAVYVALDKLLNANLHEMGERAAALIRERYALPGVVHALEQTYADVVQSRHAGVSVARG